MTSFYDNLSEEMSMLIDNPQQEEITNFIINGEELNDEAKLIYEKNRINNCINASCNSLLRQEK